LVPAARTRRAVDPDKFGLEAYLCQITYKRLKTDPAKTRSDAALQFVSGVVSVAELQAKGFAYLTVVCLLRDPQAEAV
jgi:intracellular sulfur oxidation DsrE/DsrF family protein